MGQIKEYLKTRTDFVSTQEIGSALNISRVTIRKYLDFLQSENEVDVQTNYGGVGRPLNLYRLKR